jgi:hypothetical protein
MVIGEGGFSGWGSEGTAAFQVMDRLNHSLINPLLLLPVLTDSRAPTLKNPVLVSPSGQQFALGQAKSLRQGTWKLYASVTDTVDGSSTELGAFSTTVLLNGRESVSIPFDVIREKEGKLSVSQTELTKDTLYKDPERVYLGDIQLTRGKAELSLIARDMKGNERFQQYSIQVE